MTTVLLLILLILVICMALRDGRPFFGDTLKVLVLIVTLLLAAVAWAPFPHFR